MVRDLIEAGANVNARDSRSLTPLHFALASETPSVQVVRTLLIAGADVNARDNNGETPLDWADKFGYTEVVGTLEKSGAGTAFRTARNRRPRRNGGNRFRPSRAA